MHDQANQLRQLVREEARRAASRTDTKPLLVAVTGGKGGVGSTTVAVNLAVALARRAHRTVLVDADLNKADASLSCRVEERYSVADVLSARRTIREVLQPGPAGIQVLPGAWGLDRPPDVSPPARQRLVEGLLGLGNQAEFIIADAGNGQGPMLDSLWRAAGTVLIVTTPELPSVMDAYASIKALTAGNLLVPIHLLVNQCPDASVAEEVHARLSRACLRFLAVPVTRAGCVSRDPQLAAAGRSGRVPSAAAGDGTADAQFQRLAACLAAASGAASRRARLALSRRLPRQSAPLTI